MFKWNTFVWILSAVFMCSITHVESNEDLAKEKLTSVISELYDIGAIKFGTFKLKSGITSSIYIDLRLSISRPLLLAQMADLVAQKVSHLKFDALSAVPYGALPLATTLSIGQKWPLVMARKEAKAYGMGLNVEGIYNSGDCILLIEDIMTTGSSIKETAKILNDANLRVENAVVFLDREQGGRKSLKAMGINVEAVITLSELMTILQELKKF